MSDVGAGAWELCCVGQVKLCGGAGNGKDVPPAPEGRRHCWGL
jgi:hypothetical protein